MWLVLWCDMLRFSGSVLRQNTTAIRDLINRTVGLRDSVIVGIPDGVTNQAGDDLASIALIHEFGSIARNIPARPFLRPTLRGNINKYSRILQQKATAILLGRISLHQALSLVGQAAQTDVQKYIVEHANFAPLKPSTIKRKGSSRPLVDTGQLRQSIRYRIER